MTKIYQYANHPTSYITFGCGVYIYAEVKNFVKPECVELFKKQSSYKFNEYSYYIPCAYVDIAAYLEYHELQGAVKENNKATFNVRLRDGCKSQKGRDWSGLRGKLTGDKVEIQFSHNQYATHEIDHKYLVLA